MNRRDRRNAERNARKKGTSGKPPGFENAQPINLWCQPHWLERVAGDEDVNGIMATIMMTQLFMSALAQDYPEGTNLSAVSAVDGPGCCYFAQRPMIAPDSDQPAAQVITALTREQLALTELDVLIHACRKSVDRLPKAGPIGYGWAYLQAHLQRVRYDLLGMRQPEIPADADIRHFHYEMVYRCSGVMGPGVQRTSGCGFELTYMLEDGCEGPRSERDAWKTPSGRAVLPVPFIAMPCPRCQPEPNSLGYSLSGPCMVHTGPDKRVSKLLDVTRIEQISDTHAVFLYPKHPEADQACGIPVWPAETRADRVQIQQRWLKGDER